MGNAHITKLIRFSNWWVENLQTKL